MDASAWKTLHDFMQALRAAIGAPKEHGWNINAFIDSIVYGGINNLEPPYTVRITKTNGVPSDVAGAIRAFSSALREHREWRFQGTPETTLT